MRRIAVLLVVGAFARPLGADDLPKGLVHVTNAGPKAVRVVVGAGAVMPCDSNPKVLDRKIEPGTTVTVTAMSGCACVTNTHPPFVEVDFGPPQVLCREKVCRPFGALKNKVICVYDLTDPL